MKTFKEIHEAADYFREVKKEGSQCLLTGGPATHPNGDRYKQVREGFRQRGVRVTVTGELGARTITLREVTKRRNPAVKAKYTGSRKKDDRYTITKVIDKLDKVGATTYVEGNQIRIRSVLKDRFGVSSCSVITHEDGIGYTVTRLK